MSWHGIFYICIKLLCEFVDNVICYVAHIKSFKKLEFNGKQINLKGNERAGGKLTTLSSSSCSN